MVTTAKTAPKGAGKAGSWEPNATFPEMPKEFETTPDKMGIFMDFGFDTHQTVQFYADHGIGKTQRAIQWATDRNIRYVYLNLASATPDDKTAIAPVELEDGTLALKQLITQDLAPGEPYIVILDDGRQADQNTQNTYMQLACNWTLGDNALEDCVLVVLLDNEGATEGIRTSEDPAVADRKVTVRLTSNDTGARYALARKYRNTDLKGVFRIYDTLDPQIRHVLSWRCLDHVLYNLINGNPGIWGLPLMDERVRLIATKADGTTTDRTAEILDKIAAAIGAPNPDSTPEKVKRIIEQAIRDRLTVQIKAGPGVGKTEFTKHMVREAGLDSIYFSVAMLNVDALTVPLPKKDGTLEALVHEQIRRAGTNGNPEGVVIWDEYNRPKTPATFAKLMEATQEWSIAGVPMDGIRAQIALCNPSTWMGRKMNVRRNNIAQADRFTISVEVTEADIPANEWLIDTYGPIAETVLEWWKSDIDDAARDWVTKRTLERLIKLAQSNLPLEPALIYLGEGDYAPVPLIDLRARLADRPMARLREIAENVDEWEAKLKLASETSAEGTNDVDQVHQAFSLSELSQLQEHIDVVVRLLRYLPPKLKGTFFIGASQDEQKFWIEAFSRMTGRTSS